MSPRLMIEPGCKASRTRSTPSAAARVPLAYGLCDEERDLASGPCLVFGVRRKRRDGNGPQPRAIRFVFDLAHPHRLYRRMVANLDGRVRPQVVDPDRMRGC